MRSYADTIQSLTRENKRLQSVTRDSALVNRNIKEKLASATSEVEQLQDKSCELKKQVKMVYFTQSFCNH